jgi:hypothetical protein
VNFITKFIAGLSDLGKILFAVALIAVMTALFVCLLIYPTMSKLSAIDEETAKEEETIKQDLHFLKYKDKIVKEAKAVDPYMANTIPSENEVNTALLKKIEILASKANVTLAKETTSSAVTEPNDMKYSADVDASGKLTDIITFMHLINTSDELTKVVKFNIGTKKADSDEIKATMTIAKVIISKKGPTNVAPSSNTPAEASANKKS